MHFLALDLGSSYTKCFVLEDGKCRESMQIPAEPLRKDGAARSEANAQSYYQDVRSLLAGMVTENTRGILFSTQMHGFVLADESFNPVSPYVSWQDRACTEISPWGNTWRQTLMELLDQQEFRNSGVPLKECLALCNLFARMKTGLSIPDGTRLCTLGGYMIGRLCGRHVCHISNAGPLGLADMKHGTWNARIIAAAGMERLIFPELLRDLSPCGTAEICGQCIEIYPDIGDQQVCAFGASLEPETGLHINIGTAGLIGAACAQWREGPFENRAWLKPGYYLRTVSGLPGGRDLNNVQMYLAQRDGLGTEEAWKRMCSAVCIEPSFICWDFDDLGASVRSLPAWVSLEDAACSLYLEMAKRYKAAAQGMMDTITSIRFSGGGVLKNPALRKALLDQFPNVPPEDDMLRDVILGLEVLSQSVQMRMEKR